ncbi:MAG: hypothetical protein ACFFDW_15775, partial [Candidatus Thorarchaeota archaeon]
MNSIKNDTYQEKEQEKANFETNPQNTEETVKGKKLDDVESNLVLSSEQIKNPFKRFWKWLTVDKGRLLSIIFLFLFVVLIVVLACLNLDIGGLMTNIVDWFEANLSIWGIYLGVFIISVFGNFTVIFPVPYTFVLVSVASRDYINIWNVLLMGLFAGAGAAIGEAVSWTLGRASKNVIKDSMEKQVNRAQRWIDAGLAPIMILIFAATPLPDD